MLLGIGLAVAVALSATYLALKTAELQFGATPPEWLREFFDLDDEATIPAWYSGIQLFVIALAFLTLGSMFDDRRRRDFRIAAAAVIVASADEVVSLHEELAGDLNRIANTGPPLGRSWWVIPGLAVAIALAVVLRRLLQSLPKRATIGLVGGAAVFFFGALVLEAAGGRLEPDTMAHAIEVTLEECMEMIGASIVLYALLQAAPEIRSRASIR